MPPFTAGSTCIYVKEKLSMRGGPNITLKKIILTFNMELENLGCVLLLKFLTWVPAMLEFLKFFSKFLREFWDFGNCSITKCPISFQNFWIQLLCGGTLGVFILNRNWLISHLEIHKITSWLFSFAFCDCETHIWDFISWNS